MDGVDYDVTGCCQTAFDMTCHSGKSFSELL